MSFADAWNAFPEFNVKVNTSTSVEVDTSEFDAEFNEYVNKMKSLRNTNLQNTEVTEN